MTCSRASIRISHYQHDFAANGRSVEQLVSAPGFGQWNPLGNDRLYLFLGQKAERSVQVTAEPVRVFRYDTVLTCDPHRS